MTIINTLAHAFVAVNAHEAGQFGDVGMPDITDNLLSAVAEVERLMTTDRLVPSYRNGVTVSGIEVCPSHHPSERNADSDASTVPL